MANVAAALSAGLPVRVRPFGPGVRVAAGLLPTLPAHGAALVVAPAPCPGAPALGLPVHSCAASWAANGCHCAYRPRYASSGFWTSAATSVSGLVVQLGWATRPLPDVAADVQKPLEA